MKPMLDPKRDLKGATPETLARTLLRPLSGRRAQPVVSGKVSVKQVPADQPGNRAPHLLKRA